MEGAVKEQNNAQKIRVLPGHRPLKSQPRQAERKAWKLEAGTRGLEGMEARMQGHVCRTCTKAMEKELKGINSVTSRIQGD